MTHANVFAPSATKPVYVPLGGRTAVVRALQLALIVGSLVHVACGWGQLGFARAPAELDPLVGQIASIGRALGALAIVSLSVFGAPFWMSWHWRAAKNQLALGDELRHGPVAQVWWWFVPVANLILPLQAFSELYRAAVRARPLPGDELARQNTAWLAIWWGCWSGGQGLTGLAALGITSDLGASAPAVETTATLAVACSRWLYLGFLAEIAAGQELCVHRRGTATATGEDPQRVVLS